MATMCSIYVALDCYFHNSLTELLLLPNSQAHIIINLQQLTLTCNNIATLSIT